MTDATVKHFIFSRFFTFNDPKYPHNIYDVDFLYKQFPFAKNMLSSLENQTNKNFELVFLVNEKLHMSLTNHAGDLNFEIKKYSNQRLISEDITKKQFEDEFGFQLELNLIK